MVLGNLEKVEVPTKQNKNASSAVTDSEARDQKAQKRENVK